MTTQLLEQLFTRDRFTSICLGQASFELGEFIRRQADRLARPAGQNVNLCAFGKGRFVENDLSEDNDAMCDSHVRNGTPVNGVPPGGPTHTGVSRQDDVDSENAPSKEYQGGLMKTLISRYADFAGRMRVLRCVEEV